jgi:hypothetical protein
MLSGDFTHWSGSRPGCWPQFWSSYFFGHMSQIPNSVGAIQPKLISGSTTREIAAITAGSGEPAPLLGQKKLQRVLLRMIATANHDAPIAKEMYAFTR